MDSIPLVTPEVDVKSRDVDTLSQKELSKEDETTTKKSVSPLTEEVVKDRTVKQESKPEVSTISSEEPETVPRKDSIRVVTPEVDDKSKDVDTLSQTEHSKEDETTPKESVSPLTEEVVNDLTVKQESKPEVSTTSSEEPETVPRKDSIPLITPEVDVKSKDVDTLSQKELSKEDETTTKESVSPLTEEDVKDLTVKQESKPEVSTTISEEAETVPRKDNIRLVTPEVDDKSKDVDTLSQTELSKKDETIPKESVSPLTEEVVKDLTVKQESKPEVSTTSSEEPETVTRKDSIPLVSPEVDDISKDVDTLSQKELSKEDETTPKESVSPLTEKVIKDLSVKQESKPKVSTTSSEEPETVPRKDSIPLVTPEVDVKSKDVDTLSQKELSKKDETTPKESVLPLTEEVVKDLTVKQESKLEVSTTSSEEVETVLQKDSIPLVTPEVNDKPKDVDTQSQTKLSKKDETTPNESVSPLAEEDFKDLTVKQESKPEVSTTSSEEPETVPRKDSIPLVTPEVDDKSKDVDTLSQKELSKEGESTPKESVSPLTEEVVKDRTVKQESKPEVSSISSKKPETVPLKDSIPRVKPEVDDKIKDIEKLAPKEISAQDETTHRESISTLTEKVVKDLTAKQESKPEVSTTSSEEPETVLRKDSIPLVKPEVDDITEDVDKLSQKKLKEEDETTPKESVSHLTEKIVKELSVKQASKPEVSTTICEEPETVPRKDSIPLVARKVDDKSKDVDKLSQKEFSKEDGTSPKLSVSPLTEEVVKDLTIKQELKPEISITSSKEPETLLQKDSIPLVKPEVDDKSKDVEKFAPKEISAQDETTLNNSVSPLTDEVVKDLTLKHESKPDVSTTSSEKPETVPRKDSFPLVKPEVDDHSNDVEKIALKEISAQVKMTPTEIVSPLTEEFVKEITVKQELKPEVSPTSTVELETVPRKDSILLVKPEVYDKSKDVELLSQKELSEEDKTTSKESVSLSTEEVVKDRTVKQESKPEVSTISSKEPETVPLKDSIPLVKPEVDDKIKGIEKLAPKEISAQDETTPRESFSPLTEEVVKDLTLKQESKPEVSTVSSEEPETADRKDSIPLVKPEIDDKHKDVEKIALRELSEEDKTTSKESVSPLKEEVGKDVIAKLESKPEITTTKSEELETVPRKDSIPLMKPEVGNQPKDVGKLSPEKLSEEDETAPKESVSPLKEKVVKDIFAKQESKLEITTTKSKDSETVQRKESIFLVKPEVNNKFEDVEKLPSKELRTEDKTTPQESVSPLKGEINTDIIEKFEYKPEISTTSPKELESLPKKDSIPLVKPGVDDKPKDVENLSPKELGAKDETTSEEVSLLKEEVVKDIIAKQESKPEISATSSKELETVPRKDSISLLKQEFDDKLKVVEKPYLKVLSPEDKTTPKESVSPLKEEVVTDITVKLESKPEISTTISVQELKTVPRKDSISLVKQKFDEKPQDAKKLAPKEISTEDETIPKEVLHLEEEVVKVITVKQESKPEESTTSLETVPRKDSITLAKPDVDDKLKDVEDLSPKELSEVIETTPKESVSPLKEVVVKDIKAKLESTPEITNTKSEEPEAVRRKDSIPLVKPEVDDKLKDVEKPLSLKISPEDITTSEGSVSPLKEEKITDLTTRQGTKTEVSSSRAEKPGSDIEKVSSLSIELEVDKRPQDIEKLASMKISLEDETTSERKPSTLKEVKDFTTKQGSKPEIRTISVEPASKTGEDNIPFDKKSDEIDKLSSTKISPGDETSEKESASQLNEKPEPMQDVSFTSIDELTSDTEKPRDLKVGPNDVEKLSPTKVSPESDVISKEQLSPSKQEADKDSIPKQDLKQKTSSVSSGGPVLGAVKDSVSLSKLVLDENFRDFENLSITKISPVSVTTTKEIVSPLKEEADKDLSVKLETKSEVVTISTGKLASDKGKETVVKFEFDEKLKDFEKPALPKICPEDETTSKKETAPSKVVAVKDLISKLESKPEVSTSSVKEPVTDTEIGKDLRNKPKDIEKLSPTKSCPDDQTKSKDKVSPLTEKLDRDLTMKQETLPEVSSYRTDKPVSHAEKDSVSLDMAISDGKPEEVPKIQDLHLTHEAEKDLTTKLVTTPEVSTTTTDEPVSDTEKDSITVVKSTTDGKLIDVEKSSPTNKSTEDETLKESVSPLKQAAVKDIATILETKPEISAFAVKYPVTEIEKEKDSLHEPKYVEKLSPTKICLEHETISTEKVSPLKEKLDKDLMLKHETKPGVSTTSSKKLASDIEEEIVLVVQPILDEMPKDAEKPAILKIAPQDEMIPKENLRSKLISEQALLKDKEPNEDFSTISESISVNGTDHVETNEISSTKDYSIKKDFKLLSSITDEMLEHERYSNDLGKTQKPHTIGKGYEEVDSSQDSVSIDKVSIISTTDSGIDRDSITLMAHGSSSEDTSKEVSLEEKYRHESSEKSTNKTSLQQKRIKIGSVEQTETEKSVQSKDITDASSLSSLIHERSLIDNATHLMESIHKAFSDDIIQQGIKTEDIESLGVHSEINRVSTPPTVPVSPLPKTPSSFHDIKVNEAVHSEVLYDKSEGSEETITKVVHVGEDVLTQKISTSTEKIPKLPKPSSDNDTDPELLALMQNVGKIKTETDTVTKIIKEGENVVTQTITTVTTKEVISREDGTPQNIKTTIETTTLSKGSDGSTTTTKDTQTLLSECSSSLRSTSQMDMYTTDVSSPESKVVTSRRMECEPQQTQTLFDPNSTNETEESDENIEDTIIDTDVSKRIISEDGVDIMVTVSTTTKKEISKLSGDIKLVKITIERLTVKDHPDGNQVVEKSVEVRKEEIKVGTGSNLDELLCDYEELGNPEESVSTKTEEIKEGDILIKRIITTRISKVKYANSEGIPEKLKTITTITTTDNYPDGSSCSKVETSISLGDIEAEDTVAFKDLEGYNLVLNQTKNVEKQKKSIEIDGQTAQQTITTTTTEQLLANEENSEKKVKTTVETVTETKKPDDVTETVKNVRVFVAGYGPNVLKDKEEDAEPILHEVKSSTVEDLLSERVVQESKKTFETDKHESSVQKGPYETKDDVAVKDNDVEKDSKIKCTDIKPIAETVTDDQYVDGSVTKTKEKVSILDVFSKTSLLNDQVVTESVQDVHVSQSGCELNPPKETKERIESVSSKCEVKEIDFIHADEDSPLESIVSLQDLQPLGTPEETETTLTENIQEKDLFIFRTIVTKTIKTKYCDSKNVMKKIKTIKTITTTDKYPDGSTETSTATTTTIESIDVNEDLSTKPVVLEPKKTLDAEDEIADKYSDSERDSKTKCTNIETALKDLKISDEPEEVENTETQTIVEQGIKILRTIITKVITTKYEDNKGKEKKLKTVTIITTLDKYPDGSIRKAVDTSTKINDIVIETESKIPDLHEYSQLESKTVDVNEERQTIDRSGVTVEQIIMTTTTKEILSSPLNMTKKLRTTIEKVYKTLMPDGSTEVTTDLKVSVADLGSEEVTDDLKGYTLVGSPIIETTTDTKHVKENEITINRKITTTTTKETYLHASENSKKIKTTVKTVTEDEYPDGTVVTKTKEKVSIVDVFSGKLVLTDHQEEIDSSPTYADDSETVEDTSEKFDVKNEIIQQGSITIKRTVTTKTKTETLSSSDVNIKRVRTTVETTTVDEYPDGSTETTKDVKITISEFQKTSDSNLQAALQGLTSTGKVKTSVDKKTNIVYQNGEKIIQTITTNITKEELKNSATSEVAVKTVTETITDNLKNDGLLEVTKDLRTQITYLPIGTSLDDWTPEALEEIEQQLVKEDKPTLEELPLKTQEEVKPLSKPKKQRSPIGEITTDTDTFTKIIKEGDNDITQTITVVTTKEVVSPEKIKITVETTTVSKGSDGVTKTTKSTKTTISEIKEEYEETIDTGESEKSFSKHSSKTGDRHSSSAASDDLDHPGISSPPSDISSRGSRAATNVWGTESSGMYYSDDDGQGSPSSTKSQIAHSPRSNLSFEMDPNKLTQLRDTSQEILLERDVDAIFHKDPMSTSVYGQLPEDDSCTSSTRSEVKTEIRVLDIPLSKITESFLSQEKQDYKHLDKVSDATFLKEADEQFEKAIEEHKKVSGSQVISNITAKYEFGEKSHSSVSQQKSEQEESKITLKDLKSSEFKKTSESSMSSTSSMKQTKLEKNEQTSESRTSQSKDPIESWGKPLGLPSPIVPPTQSDGKSTPKKQTASSTVLNKNKINQEKSREAKSRVTESPSKKKPVAPVYMELTYVPHHGNSYYSAVEFFKRVRARYYVFSGTEPSKEIYNALLDAKKTWEDKDLEVTIIPTYDTDVLGYWVTENEEALEKYKIDLSPSASRCTINLQDHETSCAAYRLEF